MQLRGGSELNQAHYQSLLQEILSTGRGGDVKQLDAWMHHIRGNIHRFEAPNVMACLYEFVKSTREVTGYFLAQSELAPELSDTDIGEFKPRNDPATVAAIVQRELKNAKKREARKELVLA